MKAVACFALVLLLAMSLAACGDGPAATPVPTATVAAAPSATAEKVRIERAWMAKDDGNGAAGAEVTSFRATDGAIHTVVQFNHIEPNLKAKMVWIAVDSAGEKNQTLTEKEFTQILATQITGTITLPRPWPVGQYRVDIYVNDILTKFLLFTVTE
jgi:hypothetical protein